MEGYIAGVFFAFVSHLADNLVSSLNNAKGKTVGEVSIYLLHAPLIGSFDILLRLNLRKLSVSD